jgi:hypothetical protein
MAKFLEFLLMALMLLFGFVAVSFAVPFGDYGLGQWMAGRNIFFSLCLSVFDFAE